MRSPYCGSSFGSSSIRRAATVTPGGGGTLSLQQRQVSRRRSGSTTNNDKPVSAHPDFLCEYEVLYRNLILQNPAPCPTTVFFNLTEILSTKKNPEERITGRRLARVEYTHFRQVSVIFCCAGTPSRRTVSMPLASNTGSLSSGFSNLKPT